MSTNTVDEAEKAKAFHWVLVLTLPVIGIAAAAMGTRDLQYWWQNDQPKTISPAMHHDRTVLSGHFVQAGGVVAAEHCLAYEDRHGALTTKSLETKRAICPLVPEGWREDTPIAVLIDMPQADAPQARVRRVYAGKPNRGGLSGGYQRRHFAERRLKLKPGHLVIIAGVTPARSGLVGFTMWAIGLLLCALTVRSVRRVRSR